MKKLIAMSVFLGFANLSQASEMPGSDVLKAQITDAEWSLRHSSVSKSLPSIVQDESIGLLTRARTEIDAGNLRTAQDLVRRASRPLVNMEAAAMNGKHPDGTEYYEDIRTTLVSLINAGGLIAAEKGQSSQFTLAAWETIIAADELAKAGKEEEAKAALLGSYRSVKSEIAGMRSGDMYVLGTPKGQSAREWEDGLRRIEERRSISSYLILEVQADGEDTKPLLAGIEAAERTVAEASSLAEKERWGQALASLEKAYVQYEDSWKKVGVEW